MKYLKIKKYMYVVKLVRGYIACTILNQYGYNTSNIDGGYKTYSSIKNSEKLVKSQDESVKVAL